MRYEIRVEGRLTQAWADWFDGLSVSLMGDETVLSGAVTDQAALHGVLRRIRDLGLPLVSVRRIGRRRARPAQVVRRSSRKTRKSSSPGE